MSLSIQKLTPWHQACELVGADPAASISMEERSNIIFRASCKMLRLDPDAPQFAFGPAHTIAFNKLTLAIIPALNGPWEQDWNSWDQKKWSCWFALNAPGFRFFDAYYGHVVTCVTGGPRLCLKSKARAEFAGTHCITLYRDLMGAGQLAPEALIAA